MTVQQVYQQPIISGQEQIVTQTLPPGASSILEIMKNIKNCFLYINYIIAGQQYIVTPNSGPIYIVPPPTQTLQTQPNQTIESISVQSQHHIIPNSLPNQHDPQPIINQTVTLENNLHLNQVQNEQIENREKDKEENKNSIKENSVSRAENEIKEENVNDTSNIQVI